MTTATKTALTIGEALALTIEDLEARSANELQELHSVLSSSKQKAASRKADLVNGLLNAKKKAGDVPSTPLEEILDSEELEEMIGEIEPETVENSTKKATRKVKAVKPKLSKKKAEPEEEEETEEDASLARPVEEMPDLNKMTQKELLAYAMQQQEKLTKFPSSVQGSKVTYDMTNFDSVEDIQQQLLDNPFSLFMFIDEKLDDTLTQFLVVFASPDVIVAIDRNKQKDSTLTINTKDVKNGTLTFNKKKFEYAFYTRS